MSISTRFERWLGRTRHATHAGTAEHAEPPPKPPKAKKAERTPPTESKLHRERRERREERAQLSVGRLSEDGPRAVTLDYPTREIKLLVTSKMEEEWRAHSCAKEPWTVAWLEESLTPASVLYDIGANVGAFSLVAASLCGETGRVVSFEPGYASYGRLCDNIVLNHFEGIIVPVPLALGRATHLSTMEYRALSPGQSRHHFRDGIWKPHRAAGAKEYRQPVFTMALDDLVKAFAIPAPHHIKLDVDGIELNVLQGAIETLARPELQSILIEIDQRQTEPVSAFLATHGFTMDRKINREEHHEKTQVWYGVFRRAT